MKKLVCMGIITGMALLIAGCGKDLKVETVKNLTVEYGDKLDNSKLYNAAKSDKEIKVSKVAGFDEKKIGRQQVKVSFTDKDGKSKTEKEITIDVKDTKAPVIELNKNEISVDQNKSINLQKNIKSVKDPVDGDIKYSKTKVDKDGYFIDEGKLDTKKPGTYEVKVIAFDKNSNKADKTFKVVVEKKKETTKQETAKNEQQSGSQQPNESKSNTNAPSNNQQTQQSTAPNKSNQNTQQQPAQKPQEPSKPQPSKPACNPNEIPANQLGNSGRVFNTKTEMDAWGMAQIEPFKGEWWEKGYNGYDSFTVSNACGEETTRWTINFY